MKKVFKIFSILFVAFSFTEVNALSAAQVRSRGNVCPVIELANAKEDGSLETVACYNTYDEAKQTMNATGNDNLVIVQNGMIIDAKYALVDYDQNTSAGYTNVYSNVYLSSLLTYIRGGNTDDAAFLGMDPGTGRIKIKVSGVVGYIARYEYEGQGRNQLYDIVPLSWVRSPSYYQITSSEIIHVLQENVYGDKSKSSIIIGQKPTMVSPGNYYSYDGQYFYTDLKTMIRDYQAGVTDNAVNKNEPYYNYYQYLNFRTKTNYNAANLNQFIVNRGFGYGKMANTGDAFIAAQEKYGVNAALMFAIGINESGHGTSPIALSKNNLFGLNAVDASPSSSADTFASVDDCIYNYAYGWLAYGYLQPGDYRYRGALVGNKQVGLNLKYASDPYWGEKAASHYYALDKAYGFQDYNTYTIAVLNNDYQDTVYAKKSPDGYRVSSSFYQYRVKNSSVVILGEIEGPAVNGNTKWYQVTSDPTLDNNLEYIGDSKSNPRIEYMWDQMKVYVPAAYFTKINTGTNNITQPSNPSPSDPTPKPTPSQNPTPTPTPPPAKPVSQIIGESGYRVENGVLLGIQPGTGIGDIKAKLEGNGGIVSFSSDKIGTGTTITIKSGNLQETYSIVIYGDVDGDGLISAVDYVLVKNHIMGSNVLSGASAIAADVNRDGLISAVDYVNIKNYIMGSNNVIQN